MDEKQLEQYVRLVSQKRVLQYAASILVNGQLTKQQCMRKLKIPKYHADRLFDFYDEDQNGILDPKEVLQYMSDVNDGHMFGTCHSCKEVMWQGYACDICSEFVLCHACYASKDQVHPHSFHYFTVEDRWREQFGDLPQYAGIFLSQEINNIMQEYDFDSSETISVKEYLSIVPFNQQTSRKVITTMFGDSNGELSKLQFLYVWCILEASKACSECNQDFILDDQNALMCTESDCEYYICKQCLEEGKCTHTCKYFQTAGPLSLQEIGLQVDDCGLYQAFDNNVWNQWKPFLESYLYKEYDRIIYQNPNYTEKRNDTSEYHYKLARDFSLKSVVFRVKEIVSGFLPEVEKEAVDDEAYRLAEELVQELGSREINSGVIREVLGDKAS
eukprot:TRINITY_DN43_c1_g1_i2.p1 TRINITY_DN43_c1_g1~~TRINITY_DN43_c1_g1_i2.p1  ORF type:complete len:387 (-),score=31.05 TRINITY_DN43_c1_g1_i2:357-1517(-)